MPDTIFARLCQYGRRPLDVLPQAVKEKLPKENYHSDPEYKPRSKETLKCLLGQADSTILKQQDIHGNGIIHYFAKRRDEEAVQMLVEMSDLSILGMRNHRQQTPLDRAIKSGRSGTKAYLQKLDTELRALLELLNSSMDGAVAEQKVEVQAGTWSRCMSKLLGGAFPSPELSGTPHLTPHHTPQRVQTPLTGDTVIVIRSPAHGIKVKTPTSEFTLEASSATALLTQLSELERCGAISPSRNSMAMHCAKNRQRIASTGHKPTCAVQLFKPVTPLHQAKVSTMPS